MKFQDINGWNNQKFLINKWRNKANQSISLEQWENNINSNITYEIDLKEGSGKAMKEDNIWILNCVDRLVLCYYEIILIQ